MQIRNRIKEFRTVPASELRPNPKNWRTHNDAQRNALRGILAEVGIADAAIARELPDGSLMLIDGHLRAETITEDIPVLILDVTEEEADLLLVTLDPLAAMAGADAGKLEELVATLETTNASLQEMFDDLQKAAGGNGEADDDDADTQAGTAVAGLGVHTPFAPNTIGDAYFDHCRETGFPYQKSPRYRSMQEINKLASMETSELLRTIVGLRVANAYHPQRYAAKALGMKNIMDLFGDDDALRKIIQKHLDVDGGPFPIDTPPPVFHFANGIQCCSNFRPAYALSVYREFCVEGGTILDTSAGYGGRLVGFLASKAGLYIGIDPSTDSFVNNSKIVADLGAGRNVKLLHLPAEDVNGEPWREQVDVCFTSPPYFCKEIYSDEPTQSCHRYKEVADWVEGFLRPMLKLHFDSLRHGCHTLVNIADVKVRNQVVPLAQLTLQTAGELGFKFIEQREYGVPRAPKAPSAPTATQEFTGGDTGEPVFVFQKQ